MSVRKKKGGYPKIFTCILACFISFTHVPSALSQSDLLSPKKEEEEKKDLDQYLYEAMQAFQTGLNIEGRSILQKAQQIYPDSYKPAMQLGVYYLNDVGHFRMALRQIRMARRLLEKKYGKDPKTIQKSGFGAAHNYILLIEADCLVNLDLYQEGLEVYEYSQKYYVSPALPAAKAWVLMKLKRTNEAIITAQSGLLIYKNPYLAATWNVLGILFSIKGQKELSLDAFTQSIISDINEGSIGSSSTPLNNAGEIYRELFREAEAETSWGKALSQHDSCEHIILSYNSSILYMEDLRLFAAAQVLDDFQDCFANNLDRNDHEHRALLKLQRGRIKLKQGDVKIALPLIKSAAESHQWFGKIGSTIEDYKAAASTSLADAIAMHEHKKRELYSSFIARLLRLPESKFNIFREAWLREKALGILTDKLEDLEDLFVRNTDAIIEYPGFHRVLAELPLRLAHKRIDKEINKDKRPIAQLYYRLWKAGIDVLNAHNIDNARMELLKLHEHWRTQDRLAKAETLALLSLEPSVFSRYRYGLRPLEESTPYLIKLFSLIPSHFRQYDLPLPVVINSESNLLKIKKLRQKLTAHRLIEAPHKSPLELNISSQDGFLVLSLTNSKTGSTITHIRSQTKNLTQLAESFLDKTFSHRKDHPGSPPVELPRLKGIL